MLVLFVHTDNSVFLLIDFILVIIWLDNERVYTAQYEYAANKIFTKVQLKRNTRQTRKLNQQLYMNLTTSIIIGNYY